MLYLYKNIGNTLQALEGSLRIAISNADNFNTPGYKYSYGSFTSVFSESVGMATETTNPMVLGSSMTLSSVSTDYSTGSLGFGTPLDVAIDGEGFFAFSASAGQFDTGSDRVYSRAGRFGVDFNNEFLIDGFGRKVMGFELNDSGGVVSSGVVPVQTEGELDIGFIDGGILCANFNANRDALLRGDANPPPLKPLYKLGITSFSNKQGLLLASDGAYRETIASGSPLEFGESSEGMYGTLLAEKLESSNVDVAKLGLDMATLNRNFAAVQGIVDDVNKTLSGLISKLGG